MRVLLLGTRTAVGPGSSIFPFEAYVDERVGIVQAEFTGTATVTFEGKLTETASWTTITTISSTDTTKAKTIALMPHIRMNVTSLTSGTVTCWLGI